MTPGRHPSTSPLPRRNGEAVANWVNDIASQRQNISYGIVDLKDFDLPHLDEAIPASMGQYQNEHTKSWATTIERFDGFVFVTPEYNHSTSGALKNAIDYVYTEWNNKAAGFVGYGSGRGSARGRTPAPDYGRAADRGCLRPGCPAARDRLRKLQRLHAVAHGLGKRHRPFRKCYDGASDLDVTVATSAPRGANSRSV